MSRYQGVVADMVGVVADMVVVVDMVGALRHQREQSFWLSDESFTMAFPLRFKSS